MGGGERAAAATQSMSGDQKREEQPRQVDPGGSFDLPSSLVALALRHADGLTAAMKLRRALMAPRAFALRSQRGGTPTAHSVLSHDS